MRTPEEIDAMLDKLQDVLDNVDAAEDKFQRDGWRSRHEGDFGPLEEKLKALNGDDFDIYNASYDEFNNGYKDLGEDGYIHALKENIAKTFARIWPEAPAEQVEQAVEEAVNETETPVEDEEKTETHIETEDKNGDGEITPDEVETHTMEEVTEPEAEAEEEPEADAEADEMAEFQKGLDEEYEHLKKYKRD